jgi:hypothetical protein
MQVSQGMAHIFRKSTGTAALSLTTASLTLDSRRHASRDQLISEAYLGFDGLLDLYKPVNAIRFGLRYINIIDRESIKDDLGHDVSWTDLVTTTFFSVPSGLADAQGTLYSVEVSAPMGEGGLTVHADDLVAEIRALTAREDFEDAFYDWRLDRASGPERARLQLAKPRDRTGVTREPAVGLRRRPACYASRDDHGARQGLQRPAAGRRTDGSSRRCGSRTGWGRTGCVASSGSACRRAALFRRHPAVAGVTGD